MALTKDEIKARVVQRLAPKYREGLTWAQLVAGVGAATALQKAELVQMARDNEASKLGAALIALVQAHLAGLAGAEADTLLADDALSLADLDRIF